MPLQRAREMRTLTTPELLKRAQELEAEIARARGAAKREHPFRGAGALRSSRLLLARIKTVLRERGIEA